MKRLKLIAATLLLLLVPFLQSCLDDDCNGFDCFPEDTELGIATIHLTDENSTNEYYFTLDNGKTVYPAIKKYNDSKKIIEGQRAFIYIKTIDNNSPEAVEGYDLNAELFYIETILTKPIIPLTKKTADSIGDDRINMTHHWVAQGYLTMEFQYYGTHNPNQKHMLNLVDNENTELVDEEGYINLEFRHNAYDDGKADLGEGLVSFKLDKVAKEMETAKGLKIRVNTIYDGIKYYKIDFEKDTRSNEAMTTQQLNPSNYTDNTYY